MAKPDIRQALTTLLDAMHAVFNEQKLLSADDWKIHIGFADYREQPAAPHDFKDKVRAKALGAESRYTIGVFDSPVTAHTDADGEASFVLPSRLDPTRTPMRTTPAYFFRRRADLILDDEAEMVRCAFPYTEVATELTTAYRSKVYNNYLINILPPQFESGGFFDSGSNFTAMAGERATYSTLDPSQPYYPKWLVESPKKPADRKFGFDQLTDVYIKENFRRFELQKNIVYVYLRLAGDSVAALIQLDVDITRVEAVTWKVFNAEGLPSFGDYFAIARDYIENIKKKKVMKLEAEAWFFYALDGTNEFLDLLTSDDAPRKHTDTNAYFEQVVDPQFVVQSTRGRALNDLEDDKKNLGSRDWLKEMVRLRFSEPWVWFWNNTYQQMFYDIDRKELFLDELRTAELKAAGPLKQKLRGFREEAERDKKILLVRRGSEYGGDKRVIGSDSSYVYFYNNQRNLVTRQPMGVFWRNTNISMISSVIYKNTGGMIPICKVLCWGGVAVMGWGIFGTAELVQGFRQYVADRARGFLLDEALYERFTQIRNRILLSVLNPVLALIPIDKSNSPTWREDAFFRGFIFGYTHDAFVAMYHRWESFAALEPASYKAIKLLMKIEGILRQVDEKLSLIKDKISMRIGNLLLDRFVSSFVDAMQGMIGMVNNLYFLDYERVEEFLETYEDLTGKKGPNKNEWDKLRHKHMLQTFREYHVAIEKEATNVQEIYADVKKGIVILQRAVRLAETFLIVEVVSGGVLMAMIWHALAKGGKFALKAGKVVGIAAIVGSAVSSTFREELIEVLKDFGKVTAKGGARVLSFTLGSTITPERMERLGQLIGQLWGGFTLNKAVFSKKTWRENWDTSKSYKGFVTTNFLKSQLSVSPVLPIIKLALFNYVFLIEKVIKESKEHWKEFEAQVDLILDGDPEFADIIENDHQLTLTKILKIINAVDLMLTKWLKKLAEEPDLTLRIKLIADLLEKVSPSQLPTFQMLRDGTFPDGGWSREAVMFVVMSHLQASLRFFAKSIEDLHQPVDPKDDKSISVMYLLQLLGFQQGESKLQEVLDRNFDDIFEAPGAPRQLAPPSSQTGNPRMGPQP